MPITNITKFVYSQENLKDLPSNALKVVSEISLQLNGFKITAATQRKEAQDILESSRSTSKITNYEKACADTFLTKSHFQTDLLSNQIKIPTRYELYFLERCNGVFEVHLNDYEATTKNDRWKIGTIYTGDSRFSKSGEVSGVDIYSKMHSDKQYIKGSRGRFIVRYVRRNMSKEFKNTPGKTLEGLRKDGLVASLPVPDPISKEHILTHLRQGSTQGSCFFSFTVTKHKIYGSKGEAFYFRDNGQIVVDLVHIEQKSIIDVHSWEAIEDVLETDTVELYSKNSKKWKEKGIEGTKKTATTRRSRYYSNKGNSNRW